MFCKKRDYHKELAFIGFQLQRIANALTRPAVAIEIILGGKRIDQMAQFADNVGPLSATLSAVDAVGQPTTLDPASVAVYDVDDTTIATVVSSGLIATVTPTGKLGTCNVQVSIAAVNQQPALAGSGVLTIIAGAAASLAISLAPATPAAPSA